MNKPSVNYLDALWVKIIRLMYHEKCAVCRKDGHDAHHVILRSDKRHRWHPLNGVFLCWSCHDAAHSHPRKFKKWLKKNIPHVYTHIRTPYKGGLDTKDLHALKTSLKKYHQILMKPPSKHHKSGHQSLGGAMIYWIIALIVFAVWILLLDGHA